MNKKDINLITKTSLLMTDIEKDLDGLSLDTLYVLRQIIENKIDNIKFIRTIQNFQP